jgi:hypothetical protein
MPNPDFSKRNPASTGPARPKDADEPIRLDDLESPIPFDDEASDTGVSHVPLDLGGGPAAAGVSVTGAGAGRPEMPSPVSVRRPGEKLVSTDRISGVKTFFTKLHPGALAFLDEQIVAWLKDNPGVQIKRTNITTGEIQAKKTEPNLIITAWY